MTSIWSFLKAELEKQGFFRILEIIAIILGIRFSICNLKQINTQIQQNSDQIYEIQQQTNIMVEQNKLYIKDLSQQKQLAEISLLQEISKEYFEKGIYADMVEAYRKNRDSQTKFTEQNVIGLIDKLEYITRLREKNLFEKNDIRVNFGYVICELCNSKYFQKLIQQYDKDGLRKMCQEKDYYCSK